MFKINLTDNRIRPVERRSFSELKLRERENLQEWLLHEPSALGEDLLIIQKEFSGFDGTQERLDLLALDKLGRLVIIENKLDDSGRDVVWQALKYAAYCSTLRTGQIIDLFQRHSGLDSREEAQQSIEDFLEDSDEDDLALNRAGSQRIFLVAAKFRREITATALWLLSKGLDVSCFQVTPYVSGDDLFLDISQIIPTPETGDFMIKLADKSASETQAAGAETVRYKRRRAYWDQLLGEASKRKIDVLARKSSSKDNWMTGSCGISGVQYSMIITEGEARVQFEFLTNDKALNKALFDYVSARHVEIEAAMQEGVFWRRADDAKSSRLGVKTPVDFLSTETWPQIIDWHLSQLQDMQQAVKPVLPELGNIARSWGADG